MVRLFGTLLIGTLVGLTAGCTLDSFTLSVNGKGKEEVINGSVDTVSFNVERVMRENGLFVERTRQGDTIRLASKTPAGEKFTLFLRKMKDEPGEKTQLRVVWEKTPNEQFWALMFQAIVAAQQPPPGMPWMAGQQGMGPMPSGPGMGGYPTSPMGNGMTQQAYPPQQAAFSQGGQVPTGYPGMRPGIGQ